MVVCAVAQVLEHMAARGKRRLADPVGPLATHLGIAFGGAVHHLAHPMAADPGITTGAIRQNG